jgi:choline dehydrogenase
MGLPEWAWTECLPAFKRLESDLDFDDEFHRADGPLPIRRHPTREWTPWQAAFVEACESLGYDRFDDANRPGSVGAGAHAMNKVDGRRISAADAWLTAEVRRRPNLDIRPETLVHQIRFDGTRALGVTAEHGGDLTRVDADEVLLCAGAIATPGILLRSGVGKRSDLQRLGISPVAANEGVAHRLLDLPGAAFFLRPRLFSGTSRHHDVIQTMCRVPSGTARVDNDVIIQPGSCVPTPWGTFPFVSLMISVGKPKGYGRIRWESSAPEARPIIDTRLLMNDEDLDVAVDALGRAWEIAQTPAARKVARPLWPRPRNIANRSRLRRKILKICDSGYHPSGTVAMGPESVDWAACDGRGNVRGVTGVRVADASLMPTIPSANIHLTVLMMAERIADWMAEPGID